jgi:hypothetical protein
MLRRMIEERVNQFNREIALASEKIQEYLVRQKRRFLCRNDLFYLCKVTGNKEIEKYPNYYRDFCDEVSLQTYQVARLGIHPPPEGIDGLLQPEVVALKDEFFIQRMYLCYRTFYKTTIISKVHSLQLLLNFPNIHIVLCHNKQENASDNLVAVKNYFLTTPVGKWFPECVPDSKEWGNMSGFSLDNRTDWGRSEESIEAVGVDTEITGRHYQIAKKNDLVTEKSVNTEEQIKKTQDWDERFNLGNFDSPTLPLQDYEGTRYHFSDLYSVKKNDSRIKLIEIPILIDGDQDNVVSENISNPVRFSVEGVLGLKKDIWNFMCQMMLRPEDPARMQFKREMISYFKGIKGLNHYLVVDPSSARKKKSDFTVMLVLGIDSEGKRYIVDGVRDKIDPKKRIDLALDFAKRYNIKGCGWEAIAFQETDCFYLEEARRKESLHFTITEIKSHKVAKEDRIRGLVPEYAQSQWKWPEKGKLVKKSLFDGHNYDLTEEMEHELLQFPLAEHDDLLDAMTFINRISVIKPEKIKKSDDVGMTMGEYASLKEDRLAREVLDPYSKFKTVARV